MVHLSLIQRKQQQRSMLAQAQPWLPTIPLPAAPTGMQTTSQLLDKKPFSWTAPASTKWLASAAAVLFRLYLRVTREIPPVMRPIIQTFWYIYVPVSPIH